MLANDASQPAQQRDSEPARSLSWTHPHRNRANAVIRVSCDSPRAPFFTPYPPVPRRPPPPNPIHAFHPRVVPRDPAYTRSKETNRSCGRMLRGPGNDNVDERSGFNSWCHFTVFLRDLVDFIMVGCKWENFGIKCERFRLEDLIWDVWDFEDWNGEGGRNWKQSHF